MKHREIVFRGEIVDFSKRIIIVVLNDTYRAGASVNEVRRQMSNSWKVSNTKRDLNPEIILGIYKGEVVGAFEILGSCEEKITGRTKFSLSKKMIHDYLEIDLIGYGIRKGRNAVQLLNCI